MQLATKVDGAVHNTDISVLGCMFTLVTPSGHMSLYREWESSIMWNTPVVISPV